MLKVFIGFDSRETNAYSVCVRSMLATTKSELSVQRLDLKILREQKLYTRKHEIRDGRLWDVISDAPMSTEFAISRFLVPHLCGYEGWAVYCDCDFLWRADIAELFSLAREEYAVMVVKHYYSPKTELKMDGQINQSYERKNWSSLMLFNCGHPMNKWLSPERVNAQPGRHLHGFCWLADSEIGQLPIEWNWLEHKPKAVHFTDGTPDLPGYENAAYADEWRENLP